MSWDTYQSAQATATAIRNQSISASEVLQAHLDRIEAVNPALNAVIQIDPERALLEALEAEKAVMAGEELGPLHGVPITIKDSIDTADFITSWGTKGRRSYTPAQDATVVQRLRKAGAIILGKTNTPELTLGGEMTNDIYGPTHNPFDLSLSPGGSSGGAAAIIAAGGASLDIGSDTGGSIRDPAHACGIYGIKPTHGRIPLTGHALDFECGPVSQLTALGPMARCVDDLILALSVLAGPDEKDPHVAPVLLGSPEYVTLKDLRIAYYFEGGLQRPDQSICEAILIASERLERAGARVSNAAPPVLQRAGQLFDALLYADQAAWLRRRLALCKTDAPSRSINAFLAEAEQINILNLPAALELLARFRHKMLGFMQDYDVILCPISSEPAQPHGTSATVDKEMVWSHMNAYNLTGWPSVAIRGGETEDAGLPFGFQIVAKPWQDRVALAVAKFLESELGGFKRPEMPPQ